MGTHFNGLTPAEAERLAILAEECGEVMQAIGKVLRHGYDDYSPTDETKTSNRRRLESEVGDLSTAIDVMRFAGDMDDDAINAAAESKLRRLPNWTHHQPDSKLEPTP